MMPTPAVDLHITALWDLQLAVSLGVDPILTLIDGAQPALFDPTIMHDTAPDTGTLERVEPTEGAGWSKLKADEKVDGSELTEIAIKSLDAIPEGTLQSIAVSDPIQIVVSQAVRLPILAEELESVAMKVELRASPDKIIDTDPVIGALLRRRIDEIVT